MPSAQSPKRQKVQVEDLLLRQGSVTEEQLEEARKDQAALGGDLGRILVDRGFVSEELLLQAMADERGLQLVNLDATSIPPEVFQAVPVQICERFCVIPVEADLPGRTVRLATPDAGNVVMLGEIEELTGLRAEPALASAASVERAIRRCYYGEASKKALTRIQLQKTRRPISHPSPAQPTEPSPKRVEKAHGPGLDLPDEETPELVLEPLAVSAQQRKEPQKRIPGSASTPLAGSGARQPTRHGSGDEGEAGEIDLAKEEPSEVPLEPDVAHLADALAALDKRIARIEATVSQAQFAAVLARIDRLEQIASEAAEVVHDLGRVLVDNGLMTLEEYRRLTPRT
jgi:hypothetical protein